MVALPAWRIRSLLAAGSSGSTGSHPARHDHQAGTPSHPGHSPKAPKRKSRLLALLATLAAIVLVVGPGALTASAHSELVSSSPANGASLDAAPVALDLTFNEEISDAGLQVVAQGPGGTVALGTPVINGPVVSVPWPQGQTGGTYTVAFRVVSADGHPIDGTFSFSYAAGGASAGAASGGAAGATDGNEGAASGAASSSSTASANASGAPASASPSYVDPGQGALATPSAAAAEAAQSGDAGFPLWVPIIVVLVGVGVGAGIAYTLRSRRNAK